MEENGNSAVYRVSDFRLQVLAGASIVQSHSASAQAIVSEYPHHVSRESHRQREMYIGHARLCVSVRGRMPILLHGPGRNFESGSGCPLVVHCWANLQSVHGFRCYDNIARTRNVS